MRFPRRERTDLVISMTLAEIFLLILFVIWYAHGDPGEDCARIKEINKRLTQENSELKEEIKQAKDKIQDLEKRLETWRNLTGFDAPPSQSDYKRWIQDAGRGNPRCEDDNTLIHATVNNGKISMTIMIRSSRLSAWYSGKGYQLPRVGTEISDRNEINDFLEKIRSFYSTAVVDGKECRFDYNLSYGSKDDYHDGRELFERYFYPARLNRIE